MPPVRSRKLRCSMPERAQPFGAGPLEELQVVGIEDDAAGVGVFPVDANGEFKDIKLMRDGGSCRARHRSRATDSCSCAIELAVEKRTKSCGFVRCRNRGPGVTATWARFITSKAKSQLPCDAELLARLEQSAQA